MEDVVERRECDNCEGTTKNNNSLFIIPEEEALFKRIYKMITIMYQTPLSSTPHIPLPLHISPHQGQKDRFMKRNPSRARGSILMITLMLLSIIGILAVSFLMIGTQDYSVAARQEWNTRTFYLARSGLEYYEANKAAMPSGTQKRVTIDTAGGTEYCEVEVGDTYVTATGIITGGSSPVASRTLKAPCLDTGSWYEVVK